MGTLGSIPADGAFLEGCGTFGAWSLTGGSDLLGTGLESGVASGPPCFRTTYVTLT